MTEIKTLPSYLTVKNKIEDQSADMYIDGEIVSEEYEDSDVSAVGFRDALKQLGDIKQLNILTVLAETYFKESLFITC